jgi:hypothetical protein
MARDGFRIEELAHAACEATAGERAALLAGADPQVHREVESLLAQRSDADASRACRR